MSDLRRVTVVHPSGGQKTVIEAPATVEMSRLIPALASRLGLPVVDQRGEPLIYRLSARDRVLADEDTFSSASIEDDDVLRLYVEMRAACFPGATRVSLPDGSTRPIRTLRPGDEVLSYDLARREICSSVVGRVFSATIP